MSGNTASEEAERTNKPTSSQENNDGSRTRIRSMDQNPLINGFHQGLAAHAWAGVSSQAWAGLRRNKRFNVGGMFETMADCAKENNESRQAYSSESIKATSGPVQLSRNAARVFQHDQQRSSEENSGTSGSASSPTPTRANEAVTSGRSNPRAYHLSDFDNSHNGGALMPSQVTRNDAIASHQPLWMQNQGRFHLHQPPASGFRSMFDTTSSTAHHGLQDPPGTSFQPLRNDTRISMGAHQQGHKGSQQQQPGSRGSTNPYVIGPVSLVNNALDFSFASTAMTLASSFDMSTLKGTGSCFSKLKSEVNSVSELISQQETFCSSADFEAFVSCSGLKQPIFKRNPRLDDSKFEKFTKAWNKLAPDSKLSIVFHGTSKHNIVRILDNGLDPKRRSGQAYGPGEYFSNNPGISVSFCNGGNEMLVFAVAKPRERQYNCPPDYVVIANNDHQLPLGSVTFKGVEHQVLSHSSRMRQQLAYLSKIADRKAQEANDATLKAEIIQHLIGKQVDIASEKYQNHLVDLSYTSKREIAMYVYRLVDKALFSFYFPELPEPMKSEERDVAAIRSVEEAERDAKAAKDAFETAKKNATSPTDGDNL
jgi:hypothetical protein